MIEHVERKVLPLDGGGLGGGVIYAKKPAKQSSNTVTQPLA